MSLSDLDHPEAIAKFLSALNERAKDNPDMIEALRKVNEKYEKDSLEKMTRMSAGTTFVTGSKQLVKALRNNDIRLLLGIPGVQNILFYNEVATWDGGTCAVVTNERNAPSIATSYYMKSGRLACLGLIGGPGITHAAAGILESLLTNTPMLIVTAAINESSKYGYQLHDVNNVSLLRPICKNVFRVKEVANIIPVIAKAVSLALTEPKGPVAVDIPCDLFSQQGNYKEIHQDEIPINNSQYKSPVDLFLPLRHSVIRNTECTSQAYIKYFQNVMLQELWNLC